MQQSQAIGASLPVNPAFAFFLLAFPFYNARQSTGSNRLINFNALAVSLRRGRVEFIQGGVLRVNVELNIEGMNDEPGAVKIKETLKQTAGVFKADVTFKRKTAIVEYDDTVVQQSTLLKKIQDLGYQATVSGQTQSEVGA
jgi:copper chaperone CopZ